MLRRRRLDEYFAELGLRIGPRPPPGWVRTIRDAVGMSGGELAARVGTSQPRISQIEKAEINGSLTLGTLERVAEALDCQLHYVLVPNQPLDLMVQKQAELRAGELVARRLAVDEDETQVIPAMVDRITELADQLIDRPGLWHCLTPTG